MKQALANVAVMTRRNLVHVAREPMQLSDVTVQPVLFTLLFIYIFGAGIRLPGGGSYKDFVLAGLLTLNLVTSSMGTAVGLSTDLSKGVIERFRALPIWKPSVLIGRSLADLMSSLLAVAIVMVTGLAVGWRPGAGVGGVIAGLAVAALFTYALSWAVACLGLVSKGPESATGIGFVIIFPLAFVSNAMVATQGMPAWLKDIADWNPVSAVTAACRALFAIPTRRRRSTPGRWSTGWPPPCCGRRRSWPSPCPSPAVCSAGAPPSSPRHRIRWRLIVRLPREDPWRGAPRWCLLSKQP